MEPNVAVRMTSAVVALLLAAGCIERALQPQQPCAAPDISESVQIKNIDKLDVLFVIDDSSSMQDNQEKLRQQVPRLIETLVTGARGPDAPKQFSPVRDLHVAVVSSDLGASQRPGCSEHGADGVLQHDATCGATDAPFLSYLGVPDAKSDELVSHLACIANIGTDGCDQEQPLEAALKALWPASDASLDFEGGPSHGDHENAGFLRSDPTQGLALLAVVVISDEDDSSPFPVSRYVDGFRALHQDFESLAVVSAIVSVPPELVGAAARSGVDFSDALQRNAYYDRISSDPRMQHSADTISETTMGSAGRRYIELAKALGENASVISIDQDDYSPALNVISDIVGVRFDGMCIPETLSRDASGTVACNVIWELPSERLAVDTPIDCGERPEFLSSLPGRSESGGKRCLVKQHPANGKLPKAGAGWYYDDFSAERASGCGPGEAQRVAFTPAASPTTGVTVTLECWSQAQRALCE